MIHGISDAAKLITYTNRILGAIRFTIVEFMLLLATQFTIRC